MKTKGMGIRESCARIAESEPEPGDGGVKMPEELRTYPMEEVVRAAVRATKANIARRIREG